MADGLHDSSLDHISLSIDGYFNDHISLQPGWKQRAGNCGVRKYHGIGDVHLMPGDRPFDQRPKRRPGTRLLRAHFGIGSNGLRLLPLFGSRNMLPPWCNFRYKAQRVRWTDWLVAWSDIHHAVRMLTVSVSQL